MCLNIKRNQKSEIAVEDIICYKIVEQQLKPDFRCRKAMVGSDVYNTPYQYVEVEIGCTYESLIEVENDFENYESKVEAGLHSFHNKMDCTQSALGIANRYSNTQWLVKCCIPKGSKYYKGLFDESLSYASNKIIYLEIVEQIIES